MCNIYITQLSRPTLIKSSSVELVNAVDIIYEKKVFLGHKNLAKQNDCNIMKSNRVHSFAQICI